MNNTTPKYPLTGCQCLVTGANGFVGAELVPYLAQRGAEVSLAVRKRPINLHAYPAFETGNIDRSTDWSTALRKISVVVHLANRAHVMKDAAKDPLAIFRETNVEGTLNLARQAALHGIKRLIYLSSIKVNGEQTPGESFYFDDPPDPQGPYARSKYEAEMGLAKISKNTGLEIVILRPPLIYGPSVKGNLAALIRVVDKGWPLPLGSINNRRDMVSLQNLVDLIAHCIAKPQAAGQTVLCSDSRPVSTPEIIQWMAVARGKKSPLIKVPSDVLKWVCQMAGKQSTFQRLAGDLRVDIEQTTRVLKWTPPYTPEESMIWAFKNRMHESVEI